MTAPGFTKREWTSIIYRLLQKRDRKVSKAITVIVFCTTQTARCFLMLICQNVPHLPKTEQDFKHRAVFWKLKSWNIWGSSRGTFHHLFFVTSFNRFRMTFDWQSSRFLFFFASQSLVKLVIWRMIATWNRRKLRELIDSCFPEYLSIYLLSYGL